MTVTTTVVIATKTVIVTVPVNLLTVPFLTASAAAPDGTAVVKRIPLPGNPFFYCSFL